jgi:hypothetical protein
MFKYALTTNGRWCQQANPFSAGASGRRAAVAAGLPKCIREPFLGLGAQITSAVKDREPAP